MIAKDEKLYPYRVFTNGGHIHQCWVPFSQSYDFWDLICDLKSGTNNTLEACYFAANGDLVMVFIDARDITAMDTPFDKSDPRTIQMHEDQVKIMRTKHLKRKQEKANAHIFNAGQSVKKRRRG